MDIKEGGLGTETNSEDGTETNAEESHVFCLQYMCGLFYPKLSQISSSIRLAFLSSALKTLSYCMHPTYEERESERESEGSLLTRTKCLSVIPPYSRLVIVGGG